MKPAIADWMPLSALAHPSARAMVARAVETWSQTWLPRRHLSIRAWSPQTVDARADEDGGGWRRLGGPVALSLTRRARSRLVGWALDERLDDIAMGDDDRRLVEAFGDRLVEDLVERVETAVATADHDGAGETGFVADPLATTGGVVAGVGEGEGAPLLALALPAFLLRGHIKRALPPPRPGAALSARREAVAGLEVRLQVQLGAADLSLEDLRGLAAGDVLVLDRRLDEGVRLAVGDGAGFASATLTESQGRTLLTVHHD